MWKLTLIAMGAAISLLCLAASPAKADDAPGQKIFTQYKCTQCHSIDALKIAKAKSDDEEEEVKDDDGKKVDPPDLSDAGKDHDAAFITKWLKKEETIDGKKHKKKFKGTDEELTTLADWLGTLKFDNPKKKK